MLSSPVDQTEQTPRAAGRWADQDAAVALMVLLRAAVRTHDQVDAVDQFQAMVAEGWFPQTDGLRGWVTALRDGTPVAPPTLAENLGRMSAGVLEPGSYAEGFFEALDRAHRMALWKVLARCTVAPILQPDRPRRPFAAHLYAQAKRDGPDSGTAELMRRLSGADCLLLDRALVDGDEAPAPAAPIDELLSSQVCQVVVPGRGSAVSLQDRVRQNAMLLPMPLGQLRDRFTYAALRLAAACGCLESAMVKLCDYTFGRPAGDTPQEVGGCMVTLAALCNVQRLDIEAAGDIALRLLGRGESRVLEEPPPDGHIDVEYSILVGAPMVAGFAPREASFQNRAGAWVLSCFGSACAADCEERVHRFVEESIELAQALGATREGTLALTSAACKLPHVGKRQGLGETMIAIVELCEGVRLDMTHCADTELSRCWLHTDKIRAKQRRKPSMSPLPGETQEGPNYT